MTPLTGSPMMLQAPAAKMWWRMQLPHATVVCQQTTVKLLLFVIISLLVAVCAASKGPPLYATIPDTSFNCADHPAGYYADMEAACQVYHMCDTLGKQFSYLCPNNTVFNQRFMVCDHWHHVNCSIAARYYDLNTRMAGGGTKLPRAMRFVNIIQDGDRRRRGGTTNFVETKRATQFPRGANKAMTNKKMKNRVNSNRNRHPPRPNRNRNQPTLTSKKPTTKNRVNSKRNRRPTSPNRNRNQPTLTSQKPTTKNRVNSNRNRRPPRPNRNRNQPTLTSKKPTTSSLFNPSKPIFPSTPVNNKNRSSLLRPLTTPNRKGVGSVFTRSPSTVRRPTKPRPTTALQPAVTPSPRQRSPPPSHTLAPRRRTPTTTRRGSQRGGNAILPTTGANPWALVTGNLISVTAHTNNRNENFPHENSEFDSEEKVIEQFDDKSNEVKIRVFPGMVARASRPRVGFGVTNLVKPPAGHFDVLKEQMTNSLFLEISRQLKFRKIKTTRIFTDTNHFPLIQIEFDKIIDEDDEHQDDDEETVALGTTPATTVVTIKPRSSTPTFTFARKTNKVSFPIRPFIFNERSTPKPFVMTGPIQEDITELKARRNGGTSNNNHTSNNPRFNSHVPRTSLRGNPAFFIPENHLTPPDQRHVPDDITLQTTPLFDFRYTTQPSQVNRSDAEDDNRNRADELDDIDKEHMTMIFPRSRQRSNSRLGGLPLNPECPRCHPVFLTPGKCTPCVRIR